MHNRGKGSPPLVLKKKKIPNFVLALGPEKLIKKKSLEYEGIQDCHARGKGREPCLLERDARSSRVGCKGSFKVHAANTSPVAGEKKIRGGRPFPQKKKTGIPQTRQGKRGESHHQGGGGGKGKCQKDGQHKLSSERKLF